MIFCRLYRSEQKHYLLPHLDIVLTIVESWAVRLQTGDSFSNFF